MSCKTTLLTKIIQDREISLIRKISVIAIVCGKSPMINKDITTDIKFLRGLEVFNIFEPNSWLIIDNLAKSIKNAILRYYSYSRSNFITNEFL